MGRMDHHSMWLMPMTELKIHVIPLQSLLEEVDAASQDEASAAAPTPQHTARGLQLQGQASSSSIPPVTPAPARRESMSLASMLKKQKASIDQSRCFRPIYTCRAGFPSSPGVIHVPRDDAFNRHL